MARVPADKADGFEEASDMTGNDSELPGSPEQSQPNGESMDDGDYDDRQQIQRDEEGDENEDEVNDSHP